MHQVVSTDAHCDYSKAVVEPYPQYVERKNCGILHTNPSLEKFSKRTILVRYHCSRFCILFALFLRYRTGLRMCTQLRASLVKHQITAHLLSHSSLDPLLSLNFSLKQVNQLTCRCLVSALKCSSCILIVRYHRGSTIPICCNCII